MTPAKFHFRSLALLVTLVLTAAGATAAPYVPRSDDQVLERLPLAPTDPTARELRGLRQALAQQPGRLDLASQLARRYTEIGRVTGDPRFAGYAQAALAGWWEQTEPPADVLLIRATLRQRTHDFDAALADLAVLLQRHPRDGQARLTRATILQVQGAFDAAASECAALRRLAPEVVWAACAYGLASVTGHLRESYDALNSLLARQTEAKPEVQAWVLSMLAEMATRAGLNDAAEAHFRAALAIDPSDHYLLTAYADWLLDQRRASGVVQLLASQQRTDALLLRQTLALKQLGSPQVKAGVEQLRARFAASRMRGDRVHLREEARFTLELLGDQRAALALARENWTLQKELADLRLLVESAVAMRDAATLDEVRQWLQRARSEDIVISRLLS
jgi:tetratricopeptide (TPR) repeat protein